MKVHARIVIEADPEVKRMVNQLKQATGSSIKEIIEKLIRQEYQRLPKVSSPQEWIQP
ncbi:ribbon-helix-helix protein, CopG family [Bacillus sp. OTU530]|uniref:ribbon-helix-helix protein, CopG family n=1 Tax=Bacillus sp. OTU530 TaxID=3043862 RepID=UPI00313C7B46